MKKMTATSEPVISTLLLFFAALAVREAKRLHDDLPRARATFEAVYHRVKRSACIGAMTRESFISEMTSFLIYARMTRSH